jgi:hypothetical protein
MHHTSPLSLLLALLITLSLHIPSALAQVGGAGVGGAAGGAVAPPAATQYPVVAMVPKIVIVGTRTTSSHFLFTQTFAVTALETWAFATPGVGSVGLGDVGGTVGGLRTSGVRSL